MGQKESEISRKNTESFSTSDNCGMGVKGPCYMRTFVSVTVVTVLAPEHNTRPLIRVPLKN